MEKCNITQYLSVEKCNITQYLSVEKCKITIIYLNKNEKRGMSLNNLNTKLERNSIVKNAGKYFVDETSDIIKELNLQGESALLGIQNKKGIYTIIGKDYIYYLTSSGKKGKISHIEFSNDLHENGCRVGKGWLKYQFMYKNIILKNNDKVWLHNAKTMFSLWSTIVWLGKNKW